MRVLLLHNRYRSEGGEERAVADIGTMLRAHGHEVEMFERFSTAVGRPATALSLVCGGADPQAVRDAVRRMRADVVHAHNLHPLLGWRALAAARAEGARTVVHLHNFRLFCAIAIGYRDGVPCFRCRGRDTSPGLRLRCRGSLGEAAAYALGLHRQQPHLFAHADAFVAVSAATARRLVELGLPEQGTRSLLNFVPTSAFAKHSQAAAGAYALVSGRLVEEKGFDTAIAAARAASVPLVIAGEGHDEPRLRALAAGGEVRFTGRVASPVLAELRRGAAVVLVPSRWEEPCPYAALDALAAGVPVLASDRGGLREVVGEPGILAPEDVDAWSQALADLWLAPQARGERGGAALARAARLFSEDLYHERLMEIYGA
jgi:glycosyltransferase involved in cell wall biosynthesis